MPPWPTMPRTARRGASSCAGGSPASAVGLLPVTQGTDSGPSCGSYPHPPPAPRPLWGLPGPPGPPGTAVSGVGRGAPRSSRPAPVPAERQCPGGQLYSDCASACPPSCSAVDDGGEGSCGEECVSGCECPPGLFWDGAVCVPAARCPCYHRRRRYNPGDTVRQLCNPWWVRGPCFRWG